MSDSSHPAAEFSWQGVSNWVDSQGSTMRDVIGTVIKVSAYATMETLSVHYVLEIAAKPFKATWTSIFFHRSWRGLKCCEGPQPAPCLDTCQSNKISIHWSLQKWPVPPAKLNSLRLPQTKASADVNHRFKSGMRIGKRKRIDTLRKVCTDINTRAYNARYAIDTGMITFHPQKSIQP